MRDSQVSINNLQTELLRKLATLEEGAFLSLGGRRTLGQMQSAKALASKGLAESDGAGNYRITAKGRNYLAHLKAPLPEITETERSFLLALLRDAESQGKGCPESIASICQKLTTAAASVPSASTENRKDAM